MFKGKPLTGWGIGSFPLFAPYLAQPATPILEGGMPSLSQMAHNQYLQLLAETGLIGLVLYLSATLVALFSPMGGLALCLSLWAMWAVLSYSPRHATVT